MFGLSFCHILYDVLCLQISHCSRSWSLFSHFSIFEIEMLTSDGAAWFNWPQGCLT